MSTSRRTELANFKAELNACNAAGRWEQALSLLESMRRAGLAPDARGYVTLISLCGKSRQWRRAVEVFDGMQSAGVPPNIFHFSSAISACGKAGQADVAMRLFGSMGAHGVQFIPEVCDCSLSCVEQAFKTLVKYPQLKAGDVLDPGHKFGVKHPNSPAVGV